MNPRRMLQGLFLLVTLLLLPAPLFAQAKAKKATPTPVLAPPKVTASLETILDRRSTGKPFPGSLQISMKLEGDDALLVQQVKVTVKKAIDDTGANLIRKETSGGGKEWTPRSGNGDLTANVEMESPARKAKVLNEVSGAITLHMPVRDPKAAVVIPDVLKQVDKPLAIAALTAQKIKLQVTSKEQAEKDKKAAEVKAKAEKAKKAKQKKTDGMEEMFDAMGDAMGEMFERLFMTAGENDLLLKVSDPGKKVFSYEVIAVDGKVVDSYGTLNLEGYTIVRFFDPLPAGAALRVNLKTPMAFAEIPFEFKEMKLP